MKIIPRILLILLAALVVVGVTMSLTSSVSAQAAPSFQGQPPQTGDGTIAPGQRPEGEHDGGSALGWLSHLIPIAAIIFVVVGLERLWGKFLRPRPARLAVK
jgi:hypothetical protein